MRALFQISLVVVAIGTTAAPAVAHATVVHPPVVPERAAQLDVRRARDLDAFGAKAFREGRLRDALLYFAEAYRLGAPSIELWNLAKCHERLDEVDDEATLLARFVDASDTTVADRAEAQHLLDEIERRPSSLVVDPGRRGGVVSLDGRPLGGATMSPVVLTVAPGVHTVSVTNAEGDESTVTIEARHGHPLSVRPSDEGDLVLAGDDPDRHRASASLDVGAALSRLGSRVAPVSPAASLAVRYTFFGNGPWEANAGLRFVWTQDRWASGTEPTPSVLGCAIERDFVASDLSAFIIAGGSYRITRRLRAEAEAGFGFDTLVASQAGGELFQPTCDPSFGYRPAIHAGLEASFLVLPGLRVIAAPARFDAHAVFGGARGDATSAWLRISAALGVAVDL